MAEFMCAFFCQRIINRGDAAVKEQVTSMLQILANQNDGELNALLKQLRSQIPPIRDDIAGFNSFCDVSQLAWLKVSYVRALTKRGGAFPRRQDLRRGGIYVGAPPADARAFVLSYAWSSEFHPSPTGRKMKELAATLDELGASDRDAVFFDYCALPQTARNGNDGSDGKRAEPPMHESYFSGNELDPKAPMTDKTADEKQLFALALVDMARLYVCKRCEVIVLPDRQDPVEFPGGPEAWGRASNDSQFDYENRGWCVSEFASARIAGTIVNIHDPAVQRVLASRDWPVTYPQYEEMMREGAEKPVNFTAKGDREIVAHIFFRMVYDVSGRLVRRSLLPTTPRFGFLRSFLQRFDVTFSRRRSVRELRGFDDGEPLALSKRQSKRESKRESTLERKDSQILVKRV